ncbi:hypothetical protein A2955_02280 [Candidatus Woesebacteria bacterium RIFCSPLOWO2_01_FULL_37_19]|uniref:Uncharacterized protein n=1 Tax=Candidatus Woesebacteria bacterium RIFCSPLOWO2_01_FULL_37_19 TaxID=1802514 RepID=A0A1F8B9Y4_9BACT|nr:MAG: hypothetical protein A2955_02280 [Candidatus Woesebacteria bacterium RIFCSPLOWO2_01_FULL_37_19]
MLKNILDRLRKVFKNLIKKRFRFIIPFAYGIGLFFGLIIAGLYPFIPSLVYCGSFFGEEFCTPFGLFFAMILTLPGYLIGGNILKFLPSPPVLASVIFVLLISFVFYFLLGVLADKMRLGFKSSEEKVKTIILIVFFILGFLVISLL